MSGILFYGVLAFPPPLSTTRMLSFLRNLAALLNIAVPPVTDDEI